MEDYSFILNILLLSALVYLAIAVFGFLRRELEGSMSFSILLLSNALYCLGYYFELQSPDVAIAETWIRFQYLVAGVLPALWLMFAIQYCGRSSLLSPLRLIIIWTIPVMTILATNTTAATYWIYDNIQLELIQGLSIVSYDRLPGYSIYLAYVIVATLAGQALLLYSYFKFRHDHNSKRFLLLFISALFPWIGYIVFATGNSPLNIDLTPINSLITAVIFLFNAYYFSMYRSVAFTKGAIFGAFEDAIIITNEQKQIVEINRKASQLFGKEIELFGAEISPILDMLKEDGHILVGDKQVGLDIQISIIGDEKRNQGYIYIFRDITKQVIIQQALVKSEENYRTLFDHMQEGFALHEIICNEQGKPIDYRFLDVNRSFERITGLRREDIANKTVLEALPETESYWIEHYGKVALEGTSMTFENYSKEVGRYFSVTAFSPKQGQFAVIFFDITDRIQLEKVNMQEKEQLQETLDSIQYLSYHDQLTGLYNRRYFEEQLTKLDRPSNLPISIIIIDVNGLKLVNDAFGHTIGDQLIKKAADVIRAACRADEIIARWGGDEFVILLPKTECSKAQDIVKRIKMHAKEAFFQPAILSLSIGWGTKEYERDEMQDVFKKAEDYMYRHKLLNSPKVKRNMVEAINRRLHIFNDQEKAHSERVSDLCSKIAWELDMTERDRNDLTTVALMHDIGKVALDPAILNKADTLTDEEWREVKRHPEIGYRILSSVNEMADMAEVVLAHHEHWDGSGYPKGLKGEDIPLMARIVSVAEAYDSMVNGGVYKKAMTQEQAIKELRVQAGKQFDPAIVEICIQF